LNFARRKLDVAKALNEGKCGGSYGDACIITGAVLSAIAATLWPDRIDGVRFVELWACFGMDVRGAAFVAATDRLSEPRTKIQPHDHGRACAVARSARPPPPAWAEDPPRHPSIKSTKPHLVLDRAHRPV
jgi:hypothetical protein